MTAGRPSLRQLAIDATYEECERIIEHQARRFARRYNVPLDRCQRAARWGFMVAYRKFDRTKRARFKSYLWTKVWKEMLSDLRREIKHRPANRRPMPADTPAPDRPAFDLGDWLAGLPEDARVLARTAVVMPPDVRLTMGQLGGETVGNCRQALREYLRDLGWEARRIRAAFRQVKEAL